MRPCPRFGFEGGLLFRPVHDVYALHICICHVHSIFSRCGKSAKGKSTQIFRFFIVPNIRRQELTMLDNERNRGNNCFHRFGVIRVPKDPSCFCDSCAIAMTPPSDINNQCISFIIMSYCVLFIKTIRGVDFLSPFLVFSTACWYAHNVE